jgi:UDP-N-acetylmuramyl pentapeptide phosphotransferase/UDP-N-acetylglucosamine-1-phosphate transferase
MDQFLDSLLPFLWAFVVSVFAVPSIVYVAHVKNLLDEPDMRRLHQSRTPRLGGMAIFAGFASALTIFGKLDFTIQRVVASCLLLFFIGLKDDIISMSAFKKFFVQILATGIVIFVGDVRITNFHGFMGIHELQEGVSYGFSFLVITGITNAINLIDGLDGLAGTLVFIISATFGIFFLLFGGEAFDPYAKLCFCLMGGVAGFLRYNMHKAIIFMGDTGSLVCGFLVAVLAVKFLDLAGQTVESTPSIAVATLIIPIFDTARVFAIRILNGRSPFSPDKNHIHHVLKRIGLSQLGVVFTLAGINIAAILLAAYFDYLGDTVLIGIIAGVILIVGILLEFLVPYKEDSAPEEELTTEPTPLPKETLASSI